jgi:hypothetical protein
MTTTLRRVGACFTAILAILMIFGGRATMQDTPAPSYGVSPLGVPGYPDIDGGGIDNASAIVGAWSAVPYPRSRYGHVDSSTGGSWTDVTTTVDGTAQIGCGRSSSLSPFAVVASDTTPPTTTVGVAVPHDREK